MTSGALVRPGFGSAGTPIKLRSNLFNLNYPQDVVLYDYSINISPKIAEGNDDLRKHIISLFEKRLKSSEFYDGIAHDGTRRLIAKLPLPRGFIVEVRRPVTSPLGWARKPVGADRSCRQH